MSNCFVITCQDIAVDSWAVEILHHTNSSYASGCQSIGIKIGSLMSSSLLVALSSVEFCNKWIFRDNTRSEPIMDIPKFMLYWCITQLLVTLYVLFFVPENIGSHGEQKEEEDELILQPR